MVILIPSHMVWHMQITLMFVGVTAPRGLCTPVTATSSTVVIYWALSVAKLGFYRKRFYALQSVRYLLACGGKFVRMEDQ
uniref:Secreted protein n=1 Tax=Parascaris equorum TaxID=6256 RepID=A0A914S5H1_PAREQ